MLKLSQRIHQAKSILLTTHKQCDGDGLGAELGLYHCLVAAGKKVIVVNLDRTPKKYQFLKADDYIQYFDENSSLPEGIDLALVLDTNDERMIGPLFTELTARKVMIAFVDHHPILQQGPKPSVESYIDTTAASTGEIAFQLIQTLGYPMNTESARAIYTSITFDTQLYRFVRNSSKSHEIAAQLLKFDINPEEVHRQLFGNQTVEKMRFLSQALAQIEYHASQSIAVLKINSSFIREHNLAPDDVRDVIDMIMNVESLEAAVIFREDAINQYKISLRSKGKIEVVSIAESLGGGGHLYAAGALVNSEYLNLKTKVLTELKNRLLAAKDPAKHTAKDATKLTGS